MLRRMPMFSLTAVLTLTLGIGANTAIFSVVERVLLRPLPYKNASRLVQIWNTYPPALPQAPDSAGDFRDFRQRAQTFSEMGAYVDTPRGLNLTSEGEPQRLEMRYATSGFFPMLGIRPIAGRVFQPAEDNPGQPLTVLVSKHLWQSRFGSNPGLVGRTVTLDGRGYTVAGVVSDDLRLGPGTDVWLPIGQYDAGPDPYRYHEFNIIGRLKPGVRMEQAREELAALNAQQQRAFPETHKNFGIAISLMQDPSARKMRTALLILLGASGLVFLVACANFVNLLMARAAARKRELAARMALGASRARLLNHLLSESVLVSLLGGLGGILVAAAGLGAIRSLAAPDLAGMDDPRLNLRVLGFTLALSLVSGVGCGLISALHVSWSDVYRALKESVRATGAPAAQRIRHMLVVAEIALAIILLTGAGLLIRSFQRLLDVNPGFRLDHVLALEVDRPQLSPAEQGKLTNEQRIANLRQESVKYEVLMQRIKALPGVQAAGGVSVLPLGTAMQSASRFLVEGQPAPPDGMRPVAETRSISPGYFSAMGIPLRRGRFLDTHDAASQNVVINEAFAEKFWPGGDAIGKRFNFCSLAPDPCWTTVVGVVGNVHQYGLEAAPTFDSYAAVGWERYVVIRTIPDPASVAQAVIAEIHKFDPTLPVTHVLTLDQLLSRSLASRTLSTFLVGLFAGLALLLATIGVYAIMSYAVRLRSNEIAVRIALGARPRNIWWLVIHSGARIVLAGIGAGIAGALSMTQWLSALLYGVTATDPTTFGAMALLLACVAMAACCIPAGHCMKMDPAAALRRE